MVRFFILLLPVLIFVSVPSAQSAQLKITNAAWLRKVCLNKETQALIKCTEYVTAVQDTYFALNPKCPISDANTFWTLLIPKLRDKISMLSSQDMAQLIAAGVVYNVIAENFICKPIKSPVAPRDQLCGPPLVVLTDPYSNNFTKQAALEILRNRGCLN